jgi:hypothetical protein
VPLLSAQAGSPPDLVLLWNDMPREVATVDVVLHLHGYSESGAALDVLAEKLPISGLDFGDPERPPGRTAARMRPTLLILPRGNFFGGRTGNGYDFPGLIGPGRVEALIDRALDRFASAAGIAHPAIGRRILTAHSGGGAALILTSHEFAPDEIHVFDGLYAENPGLAAWAGRAILKDVSALAAAPALPPASHMARSGGALRVFYVAGTGTEAASLLLAASVEAALDRAGSVGRAIAPWYRVEAVSIPHMLVCRQLGWKLLADAATEIT